MKTNIATLILFLAMFSTTVATATEFVLTPRFISGGVGSGLGKYGVPESVAIDSAGRIVATDKGRMMLHVYSGITGLPLFDVGGLGSGPLRFNRPNGIVVDRLGRILIAEQINRRIQILDSDYQYVGEFGVFGTAPGGLLKPMGIDVDSKNQIYVTDVVRGDVQVFSPAGSYLFGFTKTPRLVDVESVHVDEASGRVFVCDESRSRVNMYDLQGAFLGSFGGQGVAPGLFANDPNGVRVDGRGRIYVNDQGNMRINVYSPDTQFLASFINSAGGMSSADGIALSENHNLFIVADQGNNRLLSFDLGEIQCKLAWAELNSPATAAGPLSAYEDLNLLRPAVEAMADQRMYFSTRATGDLSQFDQLIARVTSSTDSRGVCIRLSETTVDSGQFNGSVQLGGSTHEGNGILAAASGDTLQFRVVGLVDGSIGVLNVVSPGGPPLVVASASAAPVLGTAPHRVLFTGHVTAPAPPGLAYLWDFGDGGGASTMLAAHTYLEPGTYKAVFTATSTTLLLSQKTIHVQVLKPAPTTLLVAVARSWGRKSALKHLFNGTLMTNTRSAKTFKWDFGDGTSADKLRVTHTYTTSGIYKAVLMVGDVGGLLAQDTLVIHALKDNLPPTVLATATPRIGVAPLVVEFSGVGMDPEGGQLSFRWEFGDGDIATVANVSHTYMLPGTYKAVLVVVDSMGASSRDSIVVQANSVSLHINFQPAQFQVPSGYLADGGNLYNSTRGFGWSQQVLAISRDNHPDDRINSFVEITDKNTASWKLALPNGQYIVDLEAGGGLDNGRHWVSVEGTTVIDRVQTRSGATVQVTNHVANVMDGFLSLTIGGQDDIPTELCYIDIRSAKLLQSGEAPQENDAVRLSLEWNSMGLVQAISLVTSSAQHGQIGIYDVRGRMIRSVYEGSMSPGATRIAWDGKGQNGERVAIGVYFVRAVLNTRVYARKFVLLQ